MKNFFKTRAAFLLIMTTAFIYFVTRSLLIGYSSFAWIDKVTSLLLMACEGFILVHAIGYARHIFASSKKTDAEITAFADMKEFPPVAIVTAARHEPRHVLEATLATMKMISYPNKTIYLLDDSTDPKYQQEADELGREFEVRVFRREQRHGAKAGIINDALSSMQDKYLVVFDADQNPMPDFLEKTVPLIEADEKIAFVQTPQVYTNTDTNPISEAAAMQQAIFYEGICEGKNADNAMFCCGTNVIFRISALRAVGSFEENSITEDFATSIKFHLAGYRSVYYNHAIAFGMAPESLLAYFKQQSRWATGTVGVLRKIIIEFFSGPLRLSPVQWWEYFLAGSYYFIGWVYFYLMLCPSFFLLFNIPTFFLSPVVYIMTFLPYFTLSMLIFYSSMAERRYTFRQIYSGIVANFLCFPVLMRATLAGLLGRRVEFVVTTKGEKETLPYRMKVPYLVMIAINILALCMAVVRFEDNPDAVLVNSFWALYHLFLLSRIFYLNK